MALPFFCNLSQEIIVSRMPVLRHLRDAVEVKRAPFFILVYFPIFGQGGLQHNEDTPGPAHALNHLHAPEATSWQAEAKNPQ
jgi:hypothetical protein